MTTFETPDSGKPEITVRLSAISHAARLGIKSTASIGELQGEQTDRLLRLVNKARVEGLEPPVANLAALSIIPHTVLESSSTVL